MVEERIRPQNTRVLQDIAEAGKDDIRDSILYSSWVARVIDDSLQFRNDVVLEDKFEVVDSTIQRCGGEVVVVGGVGKSPELAWLIFGVEDDSAGLLGEVQRFGDTESGVKEVVNNVGIPLDDEGLDVSSGRVVDSVIGTDCPGVHGAQLQP